jgi:hypothetical protein
MVKIVRSQSVEKSWDRFVERHAAATVGHLSAWGRIAQQAYGAEPIYLTAEDAGEPVGVLPLVLTQSRLFGRRLTSMPFLDYGGVLAEPGRGVEQALVEAALAVARERRAQTLRRRSTLAAVTRAEPIRRTEPSAGYAYAPAPALPTRIPSGERTSASPSVPACAGAANASRTTATPTPRRSIEERSLIAGPSSPRPWQTLT